MIKNLLLTIILLLFFIPNNASGQCMLREISLKEKTKKSALVIEAKVIDKISYWNEEKTRIYSSNVLEVYKLFKGQVSSKEINLITEGGIIENNKHTVQHALDLKPGDVGIFFIEENNSSKSRGGGFSDKSQLLSFGGVQGFIKYDKNTYTASGVFNHYSNIEVELYPQVTSLTGEYAELNKLGFTDSKESLKTTVAINEFSPLTVAAGIEAELTIRGTGFGSAQGTSSYVEFKDANSGGLSYYQPLASQYILWEDNKIIVKVPSRAGTGTFRITIGATTVSSSDSLTVTYSHLNALVNGNAFQTNLIDNNSSGGYTWRMNNDFSNKEEASEAFKRAFISWRCGTHVKWELGNTTTTDVIASDGINIIRFDKGAELPAGVLGACYTYWNGCGSGSDMNWFVKELDIVFDDSINWSYSPARPQTNQFDFESIALHELGHGHQLGHIINSKGIMHYSVSPGKAKKDLDSGDIKGGNYIIEYSKKNLSCNNLPITPLNASNCSGTTAVASVSIEIKDGANPACEGTPVTFHALAENGGLSPIFEWKINGTKIGTNSTMLTTLTLKNNDNVSCIMTSSMPGVSGSPAVSNEIKMNISPKPLPEVIPLGLDSLTSSISGTAYQWFYKSIPTSETSKSIKPVLLGNYSVWIRDNQGCESDISPAFFYNPLGLNEQENHYSIKVHPNPTSGTFAIELNEESFENTKISVSNILGQKIYQSSFNKVKKMEINLSGNPKGIYFLLIQSEEKLFVAKIVLKEEVR